MLAAGEDSSRSVWLPWPISSAMNPPPSTPRERDAEAGIAIGEVDVAGQPDENGGVPLGRMKKIATAAPR